MMEAKEDGINKIDKNIIKKYYFGELKDFMRYFKSIEPYFKIYNDFLDNYDKINEFDIFEKYGKYIEIKCDIKFDVIKNKNINKLYPIIE